MHPASAYAGFSIVRLGLACRKSSRGPIGRCPKAAPFHGCRVEPVLEVAIDPTGARPPRAGHRMFAVFHPVRTNEVNHG